MQFLSSQANPLPTPAESQPTKRQLAQRARRQRELVARFLASQSTTTEHIHPPTPRQHAQSARHNGERAIQNHVEEPGSIMANPLPTPSPTQYPVNRRTRRGTRERALRSTATSPTPGPGDNQNPDVNQPNRRQIAQRLRRERERAARAAATDTVAASNQQASSITSGAYRVTPAPSQASERCTQRTATAPSNPTNRLLPRNPLSPPSTQQINASRKLTIMKISVCFLII